MALIEWGPALSIGIHVIDDQHRLLVKMVNDLHIAMQKGQSKEVIGGIISGLLDYTVTHFGFEEKLFDQFVYPDAAPHKKEHAAFVEKAAAFKKSFEETHLSPSIDVMNFLSDWLKKHIQGTDKKYAPLFLSKGLK